MKNLPPAPGEIWQEFHWAFFLHVQGLILSMQRLALMLDRDDMPAAEQELNSATVLMHASASAMVLAGSFTKADYNSTIRPSMMQPHVVSDNFSGLLSWEHGVLVKLWRDMRPRFACLPEALDQAHQEFADAYRMMSKGHMHICAKFVGQNGNSLRTSDREALQSLKSYGRARLDTINPPKPPAGCPEAS